MDYQMHYNEIWILLSWCNFLIYFRPIKFIKKMTLLDYLAFKYFDFELIWWTLFQIRGVHIEFDIYVLSMSGYLCWLNISNSIILLCLPNVPQNLFAKYWHFFLSSVNNCAAELSWHQLLKGRCEADIDSKIC